MKIFEKIKENKIFFTVFILSSLLFSSFLVQHELYNLVENYYYPLYVINYDCGLSSRLLIGSIFSLFFENTLSVNVIVYALIATHFLAFFCLSLFINNRLKNTEFEYIGLFAVFIILAPQFLGYIKFFGIIDTFWFFCVIGALFTVDKKGWRWLVPVFCIIGLAIHEVFATTYLPVIAIAVLYQFIKKPNVSNFIFIAVCAVVVGAASVYFLIIGDETMKITSDEMVQFARDRLDAKGKDFDDFYIRSAFFWELPKVENYENNFLGYLKYNFEIYTKNQSSSVKENMVFVFLNLLMSIPFVYLIFCAFKADKKPARKFIWLCSLAPILLVTIQISLSTDTPRFSLHWLLILLFLLLFFVKEKDPVFCKVWEDAKNKLINNKTALALLGLIAARIVLSGVRV